VTRTTLSRSLRRSFYCNQGFIVFFRKEASPRSLLDARNHVPEQFIYSNHQRRTARFKNRPSLLSPPPMKDQAFSSYSLLRSSLSELHIGSYAFCHRRPSSNFSLSSFIANPALLLEVFRRASAASRFAFSRNVASACRLLDLSASGPALTCAAERPAHQCGGAIVAKG
jgi:hypothetical protein